VKSAEVAQQIELVFGTAATIGSGYITYLKFSCRCS